MKGKTRKMNARRIQIFRYTMRAGEALNRLSGRRTVDGFLLRNDGGYGCVQPWPEFGHGTVEDQLAALAAGRKTPLIEAALRCAAADRSWRKAGKSAFDGVEVPPSHATIIDTDAQSAGAWDAGFRIFKLKAEASERQSGVLGELVAAFPEVRLRLDFNEVPDAEMFETWWRKLDETVRVRVDFVEDPFPLDTRAWLDCAGRIGARFAVDRGQGAAPPGVAAVRVLKPAWGEDELPGPGGRDKSQFVFTSAMDHPLGQAWAARVAAREAGRVPGRIGICGLQTHHLFDPDPFTECLGPWRPTFQPPGGSGLGFDDLLAALSWEMP